MKAKISVTQAHIKNGIPLSHKNCPIALAMKEMDIYVTEVGGNYVELERRFDNGYDGCSLDLPIRAKKFINNLDTGGDAKPFTFTLNIPNKFIK